ncbi:MAG: hypothetical protein Q8M86_08930, partial [Syntrophales bacterium]|nr:hypothetical protein [Syntrophales bacterium]
MEFAGYWRHLQLKDFYKTIFCSLPFVMQHVIGLAHPKYYHRPKRRPKSPDKKGPLIEKEAIVRLSTYFMKRLSYSCS